MDTSKVSENGNNTDTDMKPRSVRAFVVIALIIGVLGGAFYWWVPLGMVFSLTGLLLGLADWTIARRRSRNNQLAIAAMLLSIAALSLDIVIAYLGLQTVTFGGK